MKKLQHANLKEIFNLRNLNHLSPIDFPNVEQADVDGLLCYGAVLDPSHVLSAYLQGAFPWPHQEVLIPLWFSPNPRGILDFKNFKIPKSLEKFRKKSPFKITFNQEFLKVMKGCKAAHEKEGVWITDEMLYAYYEMYKLDLSYSVECWLGEELVGGLYGVCIGNFFSAESMFYLESNASKMALLSLVELLKRLNSNRPEKSVTWLDTQMITPVVESMGGVHLQRNEFMTRLLQCDFSLPKSEFFP